LGFFFAFFLLVWGFLGKKNYFDPNTFDPLPCSTALLINIKLVFNLLSGPALVFWNHVSCDFTQKTQNFKPDLKDVTKMVYQARNRNANLLFPFSPEQTFYAEMLASFPSIQTFLLVSKHICT